MIHAPLKESWYVLYTMPRCERRICQSLSLMEIASFLPTQKVVRQWTDRKRKVEVPLFPNYVFVNIPPQQRSRVFVTKGIIRYVSIRGEPCEIPASVIDSIKIIIKGKPEVINGIFCEGDEVIVCRGPLAGLNGRLVEKRGKYRVCVRLEVLNHSILVEVLASEIQKVSEGCLIATT